MSSDPERFRPGEVVRMVRLDNEPGYYAQLLGRVGRVIPGGQTLRQGHTSIVQHMVPPSATAHFESDEAAPYAYNLEPADEEDLLYQRAMDELER